MRLCGKYPERVLPAPGPAPGGGTGERAIAPLALYGQRIVAPEREGLLPPAS
jgi:hypothetical protein